MTIDIHNHIWTREYLSDHWWDIYSNFLLHLHHRFSILGDSRGDRTELVRQVLRSRRLGVHSGDG